MVHLRHLSRTALLFLAAFSVPLVVELRTLLGLVGLDVGWRTVFAVEVIVLAILTALAFLQEPESPEPTEAEA